MQQPPPGPAAAKACNSFCIKWLQISFSLCPSGLTKILPLRRLSIMRMSLNCNTNAGTDARARKWLRPSWAVTATFLFFLVKGLAWLAVPLVLAYVNR